MLNTLLFETFATKCFKHLSSVFFQLSIKRLIWDEGLFGLFVEFLNLDVDFFLAFGFPLTLLLLLSGGSVGLGFAVGDGGFAFGFAVGAFGLAGLVCPFELGSLGFLLRFLLRVGLRLKNWLRWLRRQRHIRFIRLLLSLLTR